MTADQPGAGRTALTNVRVFDGEKVLAPGTVVIDGPVVAAAGVEGAREVDGRGGVLLPGLIDAHIHLKDLETLQRFAAYGITTALDMGTWPSDLVDSLRGRAGLTDIRSSTVGATSPDSAHARRLGRPAGGLVAEPGDAERYVAERIAEGADYIKIIIDLPGFDQPTVDALVAAAHRRDLRTITHASSLEAVRMAQRAGVDVLTHAPLDRALAEEDVARAVADGRVIVPTLAMMEGIVAKVARPGSPGPSYEAARASVEALYRAGVPVLAGTDANDTPGVPASPPFGESLHHELELLTGAGLSTVEALRAATVLPARFFGLTDRGVIAPGKRADLLLVSGNPVDDIRATRTVERVWCAGVEVVRS